jgi:hypothetical protein
MGRFPIGYTDCQRRRQFKLASQIIDNARRHIMYLAQEPAIQTNGTQLDGKVEPVAFSISFNLSSVTGRECPVPGHLFIGKLLRECNGLIAFPVG